MRSRYKVIENGIYFITSTIVEWIHIFEDNEYSKIIIEELKFRKSKNDLKIFGYVIMPNHIHLIISSDNVSKLMRSLKSYTAKKIIELLTIQNNNSLLSKFKENKRKEKTESIYQVWQEGYHPKQILSIEELNQKLEYIHFNPVKNGLIDTPGEWNYSSYNSYYNEGDIIIEVDNVFE